MLRFMALAMEELEIAKLLAESGRYRLCLLRSYYAMYYGTQALLLSEGFTHIIFVLVNVNIV